MRYGVMMDFSPATRQAVGAAEYSSKIESHLPWLNIEKVLGGAVVHQSEQLDKYDGSTWLNAKKHPKASWPGILLRAHLDNPTHGGVNPAF